MPGSLGSLVNISAYSQLLSKNALFKKFYQFLVNKFNNTPRNVGFWVRNFWWGEKEGPEHWKTLTFPRVEPNEPNRLLLAGAITSSVITTIFFGYYHNRFKEEKGGKYHLKLTQENNEMLDDILKEVRGVQRTLSLLQVKVDEDLAETQKKKVGDTVVVSAEKKKNQAKKHLKKDWDSELTDETLPIWLRNPKEVSKEEHDELYKKFFNEFQEPLAASHEFWEKFGKHLMWGCIGDPEKQKRLAPFLRFFSSRRKNVMTGLDEYVDHMKPDQKDIYYVSTVRGWSGINFPLLVKLQKDVEVLIIVHPIDEVFIQNLKAYKEKNFIEISKKDLDLGDKNEAKEEAEAGEQK